MLHQQLCDSEVCQGEGSHPHSGLNLGGLVLLLLARKFSVSVFATPFQLSFVAWVQTAEGPYHRWARLIVTFSSKN